MVVVTAVAVARAGLPALLTRLANLAVRKIPGIRGKVRRVEIDFLAPGVTVKDVSVAMLNGSAPGHRIEVGAITVNGQWKALLKGALVASVRVAPRLSFNADRMRGAHDGNGTREAQREKSGPPWQDKLTQLPRFKVASAILTDGKIRVVGAPGERGAEVSVDRLNLRAETITNSTELAPTLMARLSADARLLSSGTCQLQAQGYPLAKVPTFNADLSSSYIDLRVLRDIIQKVVDIDVHHGIAGLYVEAAAADGYITGYAKPVFDHLELEPRAHSGFFARLKGWGAKAVAWLVTNTRKDRIATRLDFDRAVDDPDLDIADAVLRFMRNAFSTAERASLEHRIRFLRAAKTPDASIIGIVALIAGASGVLSELKSALNTIWRTQEPGNVKEVVKKNALFLGMLLGIGFLMTISLILSAALASLGKFLTGFLPAPEIILQGIDFLLSGRDYCGSLRRDVPVSAQYKGRMARRLRRRRCHLAVLQCRKDRTRALYRKIRGRILVRRGRIDISALALDLLFRDDFLFRSGIHQSIC
jgi:Virulence factor BrkB/Domain of Unknown Function (DUF748)